MEREQGGLPEHMLAWQRDSRSADRSDQAAAGEDSVLGEGLGPTWCCSPGLSHTCSKHLIHTRVLSSRGGRWHYCPTLQKRGHGEERRVAGPWRRKPMATPGQGCNPKRQDGRLLGIGCAGLKVSEDSEWPVWGTRGFQYFSAFTARPSQEPPSPAKSLRTGCQEARGQPCGKWESHSEYPYGPPEILFGTRQNIFLVWFFSKGWYQSVRPE